MAHSTAERPCLKAFSYFLGFVQRFILILLFTITAIFANKLTAQKPGSKSNSHKNKAKSFAAQPNIILSILNQYPQYFDTLVKSKKYHIKIIYTQINRKANNEVVFTDYYFNADTVQYFYPASTVKLPTSILTLQKLNELKIAGLDKNTTMITGMAYSGQSSFYNDPDTEDGRPTIGNYIKKIFLASDNDAFNRLYEFLGQEYINNTLHTLGFKSPEIIHRLNISLTEDENRHTNPVTFYNADGSIIYYKPLAESKLIYSIRKNLLGKAYFKGNVLVHQPFDFSKKN
ncbi:MAG TPA: serine hydrolase, partial [Flavisolibacter sp.]|nr:serine hydrolase [Flavisolibacter sp.]